MTNNFQNKYPHKQKAHPATSGSFFSELQSVGTLIFGFLMGVFATSLVVFLLSPTAITLKIPNSGSNQNPTTTSDAATLTTPEPAIAIQEPRFDFYSELTKTIPDVPTTPTNISNVDLKSAPKTINSYLVQAGSYKKNSDADAVKAKLTLNGFNAKIEPIKLVDGEIRHRIILGPFKTEKHAQALQQQLKALGVDSIIKAL